MAGSPFQVDASNAGVMDFCRTVGFEIEERPRMGGLTLGEQG